MSIHFIVHGRLAHDLLVRYMRDTYRPAMHVTNYARHASALASSLPTDTSTLFVAGGDGTLHEVVHGLMQRAPEERPPILLLPLGSGNDTARMIGARATIADVQRRFASRNLLEWDVLECAVGSEGHLRFCTNVLDVGFGGEVARRFNSSLRRLPARLGYVVATLQSFVRASPQQMKVVTERSTHSGDMLLTAIANSKWFGSGIGIAPHAQPDDGELDITLVKDVGPLTYLRFLPALMKGIAVQDPRIDYVRGTTCSVETSKPLPIEIDGEFAGFTPLTVKVHPKAVRLLV